MLKYKDSKLVGYEDQAANDKDKKARAKKIAEGKLAPEAFDKLSPKLPRRFIFKPKKTWTQSSWLLQQLDDLCTAKFGHSAPSFGKVKAATEEVRHTVHQLLQKNRNRTRSGSRGSRTPRRRGSPAPEGASSEAAAG